MAVETFGSGIPDTPRVQLEAREKLLSQEGKSIQQTQIINSNTAWVKLRSSSNRVDDPDYRKRSILFTQYQDLAQGEEGPYSQMENADLAKNFILISGTQTSGLGARSGVNSSTTFDNKKAYNTNTRLGTRPMPGITSFNVASKGTYGTLQQATVGFIVWSRHDLEACEKLYFRPGFSVIVEWGHSLYTSDGTDLKSLSAASTISDGVYFDTSKKFSDIEKEFFTRRKQYRGNYDGFLGLVQNFSWSLRSDGGYDCSIKVVSKGFVLESLTLGKTSDVFSSVKYGNKEQTREARKSIFHSILLGLAEKNDEDVFDGKSQLKSLGIEPKAKVDSLKEFPVMKFSATPGDTVVGRLFNFIKEGGTTDYIYVPLYHFLDIMNKFILIKAGVRDKNGKFTASENIAEFDLDSQEQFKTFPEHYSVDPIIAFPPAVPKGEYSKYSINVKKRDNPQQQAKFAEKLGDTSFIKNIPIQIGVILSEVEALISSENEEGVGALDIVKSVLAKIARALGNVNDFDIQTVETSEGVQKYTIVDRGNLTTTNPPTIRLTGLRSTLASVDLSSRISSTIASQIAIAAQEDDGDYQNSIGSILDWNKGVIDRHAAAKGTSDTSPKELENNKSTFKEDRDYTWGRLNDYGTLDKADFDNIFQEATVELQQLSDVIKVTKISEGVVPVELSIKMLGISGLKIGTTFNIRDNILPTKYNKFSYIITGLDHEIGTDNRWYTNIKTQFYLTQKNS